MSEHTEVDFQVVKKRGPKPPKNSNQNLNQKKLTFKELLFERNNLKKYQHSPKVDLRERNNTYVVRMELAGLSQSDVNVQVRDSQFLLVSGTKNNQNTQESDNLVYSECHYGNFMRRVKVPAPVSSDINYSLNNGVLYVTLEKLEQEQERETLPSIPEDKPLDFSTVTSTGNWADEM